MIFNSKTISLIAISTALVSTIRSESAPSKAKQNYKDIYDWSCEEEPSYESNYRKPVKSQTAPVNQKIVSEKVDQTTTTQKVDAKPTETDDDKKIEEPAPTMDTASLPSITENTDSSTDATSDEYYTTDVAFPDFGGNKPANKQKYDDEALSGAMQVTVSSTFFIILLLS